MAALQAELASANEKLSAYQAAENAAAEQKKNDLITAYSTMLTEEEMKPVTDKKTELSPEDMEARLAVTYMRKHQAEQAQAASQLQVNIGSIGAPAVADDLPEFMKQAMEIDKQMRGGITLKA